MTKRVGLPPVILLYQPPPNRMELRDLAWSTPRPVRSEPGHRRNAKHATTAEEEAGDQPHTFYYYIHSLQPT